jgi:hypothetical protein
MKRRGRGLEFDDDSEEDDDDDHARRIRRRMHKKRRIEGDSLDDLGQYVRGVGLHTCLILLRQPNMRKLFRSSTITK